MEDPGIYASRLTHVPINPGRVVGIFTQGLRGLQNRSTDDLSGASGIPVQSCKNFFGRSLVDSAREFPIEPLRRPLGLVATAFQKLVLEFPCGWAFERSSLLLPEDRSPVTFYLNAAYFGHGAYGIKAASLTYFGKRPKDLSAVEAATLAGLLQAPSYYDPWTGPGAVTARRNQILRAMEREGYISTQVREGLENSALSVLPEPHLHDEYSQPMDQFTQYLMQWMDAHGFRGVSTAGLQITTSIDPRRQQLLDADVRAAVARLAPQHINNGAGVVLGRDGAILAWFGGLQPIYGTNSLPDMVSVYPHQPGSAIKPLLYSCALETGVLAPDGKLNDTPREISGRYRTNWDGRGWGIRPARDELIDSRNVAAFDLTSRLGSEAFRNCLGERFRLPVSAASEQDALEIGIGLVDASLLDVAGSYTVLANAGTYQEPTPVLRIRDRDGHDLYTHAPTSVAKSLSSSTTEWVTSAMTEVSHRLGIGGEVATKTGSTPSSSYAVGYSSVAIGAFWLGRTEAGRGPLQIDDVEGREAAWSIWRTQAALH